MGTSITIAAALGLLVAGLLALLNRKSAKAAAEKEKASSVQRRVDQIENAASSINRKSGDSGDTGERDRVRAKYERKGTGSDH